jgi:hypothetical protein
VAADPRKALLQGGLMLPADPGIGEAVEAEPALIRCRPVAIGQTAARHPVILQLADCRIIEVDLPDDLFLWLPHQLVRDQSARGVKRDVPSEFRRF